MLRLGSLDGNPYIGVYCATSENHVLVSEPVQTRVVEDLSEVLGVDVILTTVAGSSVVGSLAAMNSNGIVLSNLAEEHEVSRMPSSLNVGFMPEKVNAAGNNILVNDKAACVHPGASRGTVGMLEDVLDVEVQKRSVAGLDTVGSVCIVTSKGMLCPPRTSEEELKDLSEFFKVPASAATLNYGTGFIGACVVANSRGAYVGSRSTPIELGKVEDGLGLY
ncbi:MAG: translation initiation factor IF-6 [Candidatus Thermoplasmatota archaeon]|nr:translation initiation factor IF-6 [Candidatus Thermoplasmatota archaeon]